ncbi:hypothetical protein MSSD1_653 [Mycoplasmopsis synoviae]
MYFLVSLFLKELICKLLECSKTTSFLLGLKSSLNLSWITLVTTLSKILPLPSFFSSPFSNLIIGTILSSLASSAACGLNLPPLTKKLLYLGTKETLYWSVFSKSTRRASNSSSDLTSFNLFSKFKSCITVKNAIDLLLTTTIFGKSFSIVLKNEYWLDKYIEIV